MEGRHCGSAGVIPEVTLQEGGQALDQQVRPWIYHMLLQGALYPCNGGGPKNLRLQVMVPSRVSVNFSVDPACVSHAANPLWEGTVRLTRERGDD